MSTQLLPSPKRPKEYTLRIIRFPKAKSVPSGKSSLPRQSASTVTWLYNRFVKGHLPHNATGSQFIAITVPFLVRAMCPQAIAIMGAVFARRCHPSEQGQHVSATNAQVELMRPVAIAELPQSARSAIATLQRRNREHATTAALVCFSLADSKNRFFLTSRSLQRRLLMGSPMSALRVLDRLERLKIISKVKSGISKRQSAGKTSTANDYLWVAK